MKRKLLMAGAVLVAAFAAALVLQQRGSTQLAAPAGTATGVQAAEPVASPLPELRRGINLSRLQSFSWSDPDRPGKYRWPPFQGALSKVSDAELDRLSALGFDFIRLPVDAGPFLAATEPERRLLIDDLKTLTLRLIDKGFAVIVDMHPARYSSVWQPQDILEDPEGPKFQAYDDLLVRIAKRLRDLPPEKVAFELMNEPQPECVREDGEDWTVSQKRLYDSVRQAAPALALVLSGSCWSSVDGIVRLDPGQYDANTLFDTHFYSPHYFTHQAITWSMKPLRYIAGLSYPYDRGSIEQTEQVTRQHLDRLRTGPTPPPDGAFEEAQEGIRDYYRKIQPDKAYVEARFDRLAGWAADHDVAPGRIVIGEFSAVRLPDGLAEDGSRLAWLEDVRSAAEARGFGWALWDYYEGFGLMTDNEARTLDREMVEALGLDGATLGAQDSQ